MRDPSRPPQCRARLAAADRRRAGPSAAHRSITQPAESLAIRHRSDPGLRSELRSSAEPRRPAGSVSPEFACRTPSGRYWYAPPAPPGAGTWPADQHGAVRRVQGPCRLHQSAPGAIRQRAETPPAATAGGGRRAAMDPLRGRSAAPCQHIAHQPDCQSSAPGATSRAQQPPPPRSPRTLTSAADETRQTSRELRTSLCSTNSSVKPRLVGVGACSNQLGQNNRRQFCIC